MDDHILRIEYHEDWGEVHGEILIDLKEIADAAGVKKSVRYYDRTESRWYQGTYVDMPLNQARKMCKLIARLASPEARDRVTAYFKENEKLSKIWADALAKETV